MRVRKSSSSGSWPLFTDKGEYTSMKHQHSNSTTDFDREKSLRWSRKTESTRVCCQLLRISEVECQQNFAITLGPVRHVYRQLTLQI